MKNKFYNNDGSLTIYALACGYIEKKENGDNRKVLEKETIFHVKYTIDGIFHWESFDNLTHAKKFFNSIKL